MARRIADRGSRIADWLARRSGLKIRSPQSEIRNLPCPLTPHTSPLTARRRGVILLVVLAILSLFTLLLITFVMATAHHRVSARANTRAEQTGDPPDALLHRALLQIVRGPRNPMSVMGAHALLEDMYGNRSVRGTAFLASITNIGNGQIIQFPSSIIVDPNDVEPTVGFFNGRVLTFVDGPAAGRSTRIVNSYNYTAGGGMMVDVLAVEGLPITSGSTPPANFIINGRPFSGTGFGFRLASFDPNVAGATRLLDAAHDDGSPDHLYTLLPNHSSMAFHPNLGVVDPTTPYLDPAGPGGANEDHDAATFQDMLLAVRTYAGGGELVPLPSLHRPDLVNYWVTKLTAGTWQNLPPEILRGCMLRPWGGTPNSDHPLFTGSNSAVHPVTGQIGFQAIGIHDPNAQGFPWFPWDVDNTGDGVADSIWVDLGMPVQTAPDGRVYKPLFAILCVDLDGKLNLNAHGNLSHMDAAQSKNPNRFTGVAAPFGLLPAAMMGPPPQQSVQRLRVGQGLGPPEISLHHLFPAPFAAEYAYLLAGSANGQMSAILPAGTSLDGRYGESQRSLGGFLPGPGMSRMCDPLAWIMQADQPRLINHLVFPHSSVPHGPPYNPSGYMGPTALSDYGTPPDLDSDSMLALDLRGQPLYIGYTGGAGWGEPDERIDSPYELNLSLNARHAGFSPTERFGQTTGLNDGLTAGQVSSVDAPFSAAELERLLRYYDVDASGLPDRLLRLAPTAFNNPLARNLVTHASFDLPVPSMVFSSKESLEAFSKLVTSGQTPPMFDSNLTQLLAGKIKRDSMGYTLPQINAAMQKLIWPESVMGVKMDLNRPLGNGRDDDNNRIVDEPDDFSSSEPEWTTSEASPTTPLDLNNDGTRVTPMPFGDPDRRARQLLARHLYVLMMLLVDDGPPNPLLIDIDGNTNNDSRRETARAIAQWAINMVDFRDRDAIMTPFEFDLFPFQDNDGNTTNGTWDVDGSVDPAAGSLYPADPNSRNDDNQSWRGLAWGVERPELVISENVAFHDRRTDDTDAGTAPEKKTDTPPPNNDNDFDQVRRPLGSLFVELFNPNTPLESTPTEFSPAPGQPGVDLGKAAPDGAPLWRLAVTLNPDPAKWLDPDDPLRQHPADEIERTVYFVKYDPSVAVAPMQQAISGGGQSYFMDPMRMPNAPPNLAPVLPNRYCVIGPNETTRIGEKSPPEPPNANPGTTRRIVLNPNQAASTSQISVKDNMVAPFIDYPDTAAPDIKPPVAIIVDAPHRLSISEPTGQNNDNYYRPPDDPLTAGYTAAIDTPLDYDRPNGYGTALKTDGTTEGFRLVHLQRLANPRMPWDRNSNPYLTVDTAPVDLTVFNGESNASTAMGVEAGFQKPQLRFGSRERGTPAVQRPNDATMQPNAQAKPELWMQRFDNSVDSTKASLIDNTHIFPHRLVHTLGYLNETFGDYWTNNTAPITPVGAFPPAGFYPTGITQNEYVGDPKSPFPWLTWNNRPYASAMELDLVPATRSSRLLSGDTTSSIHFSLNGANQPYDESANYGVFPHLLNLFHSQGAGARGSPHLYRLLEYVQVPSKFVGTQTWFNPALFSGPSVSPHSFHPPFNHVSNFRDPGRINVNTIFDLDGVVWGGILDTQAFDAATTLKVATSRQGYSGGLYQPNATYPTIFAKPFRSYGGNTLVPIKEMRDTGVTPGKEIDSTLLREYPAGSNKPLFEASTGLPHNDPNNNPYFRYQDLSRLSNMLTTRSNVYAIWITVGYFEVKYNRQGAGGIDKEHPDGYELTTELGIDTGEVQRHRAFYIYDRSIPVGFQRGENHNVEDGIMLRRFIE